MRRLSLSVREELARRLATGAIAPGQRLPPEPEFAAELGVSRATLREALRSLEEDGFVTRRRGAGTYATHRPRLRNNLDVNFGVTAMIRAAGMEAGTSSVELRSEAATPEDALELGIGEGDEVAVLERVRTADGRPVVYSRDLFLPDQLDPGALEGVADGSVYDVLARRTGRAVHHGVVTIEPATADRRLARLLKVRSGSQLLYLRQVDYDRDGAPILLSHEHHVADAFEFSVVRRGPGNQRMKGETT